jgi:hypothetical protein
MPRLATIAVELLLPTQDYVVRRKLERTEKMFSEGLRNAPPIPVRRLESGLYAIIDGHSRACCYYKLGFPCNALIADSKNDFASFRDVADNLTRFDMNEMIELRFESVISEYERASAKGITSIPKLLEHICDIPPHIDAEL